jgi:hypothetical protein
MPRHGAELVDGGGIGRRDLLERETLVGRRLVAPEGGDLAVVGVVAVRADEEGVLPVGGEGHELHRLAAAHHADVGADLDVVEAEAGEDLVVGLALELVGGVETGVVGVQAIGVLHGELADADEAAARAGLIAPLGLEVVDHDRQLAPRADVLPGDVGDDLLVGHGEDQVTTGAVLEAGHLGADQVVTAGLAPDVGGVDDRHQHLLPPDGVHLLADDGLDLPDDAPAHREEAEDAGAKRADETGPEHEGVADQLDVGGGLADGAAELVRHAHGGSALGVGIGRAAGLRGRPLGFG